jgi:phage terminase large subunit-like protein
MAQRTTPKSKDLTAAEWVETLALLPRYDCFRNSAAFYFCDKTANLAVRFFETRLRHMKGPKAGAFIVLERWQKAVLGAIFGWKRHADHTRRYREVFFYIPRKNGKTIFLAGIAVLMLMLGKEGGQEIYSAAAEKEQAKIAHSMAKSMIEQDGGMLEKDRKSVV